MLADDAWEDWRSDRREHWERIVRTLARYMDWRERTSRPTWDRLAAAGARPGRKPLHRSTVHRCLVWLARRGYLGVVESGSTPDLRAGVLHGLRDVAEGNRAALYVLTQPGARLEKRALRTGGASSPDENATLSGNRRFLGNAPVRTRARETDPEQIGAASGRRPVLPRGAPGALAAIPQNRAEDVQAAAAVLERAPVLRPLSAAAVASLARPFWRSGWNGADVIHALNHRPDGRRYGFTAGIRHPAGWAAARLAAWLGPDGRPQASASQIRAAEAARIRAELETRRAAAADRIARAGPLAAAAHRGAQLARSLLRSRPRPPGGGRAPAATSDLGKDPSA